MDNKNKTLRQRKQKRGNKEIIPQEDDDDKKTLFAGAQARKRSLDSQRNSKLLSPSDLFILSLLTIASFGTRFYKLEVPEAVVFDEYHFGKFVNGYFTGNYFFDIHPPLGKLFLALGGYLWTYDPSFDYTNIGAPFPDKSYVGLRIVAAVFGSLCVPVIYLLCRALDISTITCSFVSSLMLLDNLVLLESRLILVDSQLLFFFSLSLFCAVMLWKSEYGTTKRQVYLVCTAVFGAMGISIKWTAGLTPVMIGIVSLFGILLSEERLAIVECGFAGAIAIVVYMLTYYIHFKLLPFAGPGDPFMTIPFQRKLIGNKYYDAMASDMPFFAKFGELNWQMYESNKGIKARHHWESKWYEWPLDLRGISYYIKHSTPSELQYIYLTINPVVAYLCLACVGLSAFVILFYFYRYFTITLKSTSNNGLKRKIVLMKKKAGGNGATQVPSDQVEKPIVSEETKEKVYQTGRKLVFCMMGYVFNLLPYVGIERCTFLYHYIPALFYAQLMVGLLFDLLPMNIRIFSSVVFFGLSAAAFWYWAPWIYGTTIDLTRLNQMRLFPRWN